MSLKTRSVCGAMTDRFRPLVGKPGYPLAAPQPRGRPNGPKTAKNDVPKVVIKEDKDVSLIVYDWNSFKINKQKIFIDFKSIPQRLEGNKLYEVIQIADSKINIIYDKNHELGEVLAKAVKNANKNDYAILILRSIICDAIRQTYRSNLSPKKLVDLQNQLMGHPLD